MIWEEFFKIVADAVVGFFDGLAAMIPPPPAFIADAVTGAGTLLGMIAPIGAWVGWEAGIASVVAVSVCMTVAFSIKVARMLISFSTAGGGSAG